MGAEIVVAAYRPLPGRSDEMAGLIARHVPLLQDLGLATDRDSIVMRSPADGTFIEVFEWDPSRSDIPPHQIPAVKEIWDAMREVADFVPLTEVPEAATPLPSFDPA